MVHQATHRLLAMLVLTPQKLPWVYLHLTILAE